MRGRAESEDPRLRYRRVARSSGFVGIERRAAERHLVAVRVAVVRLADAVGVGEPLLGSRPRSAAAATCASRSSRKIVTTECPRLGVLDDVDRAVLGERPHGLCRAGERGSPNRRSYHGRAAWKSRTRRPAKRCSAIGASLGRRSGLGRSPAPGMPAVRRRSPALPGSLHEHRAHHPVVLVGEDVAVEDVLAR